MKNIEKEELLIINGGSEFSEAVFRLAGFLYECHKKTVETLKELRENDVDHPHYHSLL